MKINLYSVKDKKVGYMNTWGELNDNAAKRDFEDAINDPRSTLNKHPYDMELYRVGTWDDATGAVEANFEYLASGVDYFKSKPVEVKDGE